MIDIGQFLRSHGSYRPCEQRQESWPNRKSEVSGIYLKRLLKSNDFVRRSRQRKISSSGFSPGLTPSYSIITRQNSKGTWTDHRCSLWRRLPYSSYTTNQVQSPSPSSLFLEEKYLHGIPIWIKAAFLISTYKERNGQCRRKLSFSNSSELNTHQDRQHRRRQTDGTLHTSRAGPVMATTTFHTLLWISAPQRTLIGLYRTLI